MPILPHSTVLSRTFSIYFKPVFGSARLHRPGLPQLRQQSSRAEQPPGSCEIQVGLSSSLWWHSRLHRPCAQGNSLQVPLCYSSLFWLLKLISRTLVGLTAWVSACSRVVNTGRTPTQPSAKLENGSSVCLPIALTVADLCISITKNIRLRFLVEVISCCQLVDYFYNGLATLPVCLQSTPGLGVQPHQLVACLF